MKICILYGSPRKKNTYAAVQVIKEQLNRLGKVDYNEYFLQTESHDFCCGCYTCIEGHEEKCPHAAHVQPVIQAMRDADGLIFATPVYVMDMAHFFLWDFHLCAGMGCHSSHSKTEHREETPPYNRPLLALFGNEEAPDPTYTRPLFCDADDAEEESRDER